MLRSVFWSNVMTFVRTALIVAGMLPLVSYAALGSAPATAPQTLVRSAASFASPSASSSSASVQPVAAYSVRESRDAAGVRIREYVLPTNVVFAVTWQGPVRPDMNTLL